MLESATISCSLPDLSLLRAPLSASAETAAASVVRLDEQIARPGGVGEGYRARIEYQEACALRAIAGELVTIEDLVLADAGASVRLSTIELTRARTILAARRAAAVKPAAWAWSEEALFDARLEVERNELLVKLGDHDWDEDARVDRWRAVVEETRSLPTMLRAAIAWDAWLQIEPLHTGAWRSTLMASALLRAGGLALHHQPIVGIGGRRSRYRYNDRDPFEKRIEGFLDWVRLATGAGLQEIRRLVLAEKVLRQVARHKHRDSRLPALIDLLMARPLISAEIVRRELSVTDAGFRQMRSALGTSLKELSGRCRYRVWGVL